MLTGEFAAAGFKGFGGLEGRVRILLAVVKVGDGLVQISDPVLKAIDLSLDPSTVAVVAARGQPFHPLNGAAALVADCAEAVG
jgi:hypothetical protein